MTQNIMENFGRPMMFLGIYGTFLDFQLKNYLKEKNYN